MSDDFEDDVRTAFTDRFDADPDDAAAAAAKATAFRDDVDEELTAEALIDAVAAADDYESFAHRYDLAIGDLAAENEDCTDSRAYRLAGFDDLAADPDIGA
jgi:phage gp36-like protein